MSAPGRIDIETILNDLYASEINASISWLWGGGIDVKLGDALNGYQAEDKVGTFAECAAWLRDQACTHYPDSEFARKYGLTAPDACVVAGELGWARLGFSPPDVRNPSCFNGCCGYDCGFRR